MPEPLVTEDHWPYTTVNDGLAFIICVCGKRFSRANIGTATRAYNRHIEQE